MSTGYHAAELADWRKMRETWHGVWLQIKRAMNCTYVKL